MGYTAKMAMKMRMSMKKMGMKKMSMKKMGSMKKMMKKSKSMKIARGKLAKVQVWKGRSVKTQGGLMKSALKKNKHGRIVSAKRSALAMKGKSSQWINAVNKARKELKVKGFVAIKKGTSLHKRAKAIYGK